MKVENLCRLVSVYLLFLLLTGSCSQKLLQDKDQLFIALSSDETNVRFKNEIKDNDSINLLNYEYIYNGGGVGIGDFNNDGRSDLFFSGNLNASRIYINEGNLQFKDITASSGIDTSGDWCTGVSVIDVNNDGFDDIYLCVGGMGNKSIFPNKLYINQGNLTFTEAAEDYGLNDPGESIQATFFDYDLDGDLDVYLLTGGGFEKSPITTRPILINGESRNTDRLYRNNYDSILGHPVYENVSTKSGILIEGFGLGVSIIDANNDRWPDIYVSNDYLTRDLLYINNHDGTFTDQSLSFFQHTSYFSMGCDVGDINRDGLFDIITVDMLPENRARRKLMFEPNQHDRFHLATEKNYGYQYMRNMLHLNNGDGFSEIGQLAGINRTDWSWAPLLADFDNDGHEDIFVTNGFGKDITDLDFVKFRNDAASQFSNKQEVEKKIYEGFRKQPAIELPNYIYRNESNLSFSDRSKDWGITQPSISNGAAYADLDNDGDLEIIVNNINQEAFIYKNMLIESRPNAANYLDILLKGPERNPLGIGSTIITYSQGEMQSKYHQVVRGFQSSVEKTAHFGLGKNTIVDSVVVIWPDGKKSIANSTSANTRLEIDYKNAFEPSVIPESAVSYFAEANTIDFTHKENLFNDYKTQPLLLHGFSNQGPGIAVGDVNGDGRDDIFIGGSYGHSGTLFMQNDHSDFKTITIPSEEFEDLGAVFFDADGDGDLDLYVASGGSERYAGHKGYRDRLYINNGSGNFSEAESALPGIISSTSAVAAGDFDQDGDTDLFVGGRVRPGEYPKAPDSYVLENRAGKFIDVTDKFNSSLRNIGMVTSATWTDFNNDSKPDLVIVGEFMRITLLKNEGGKLTDITEKTALSESYGMWNSILPVDLDNDGDMDFVAGNLGLNTSHIASPDEPFRLHYADFDENGAIDPIFSLFEQGDYYPSASLDQLAGQLPMLKKYILHYRDYVKTTTEELLKMTGTTSFQTLSCHVLTSSFIENLGNEHFAITALPRNVQIAPINGIVSEDIDADGRLDLVLVGNMFNTEVVNGRYDASVGSVLLNKGNHNFQLQEPKLTNFRVKGDAKGIVRVELSGNRSILMIARNNDAPKTFEIRNYQGFRRLSVTEYETSALATLSDGSQRKTEFFAGSSYLSQSSRSLVITPQMERIEFFDSKGNSTRIVEVEKIIAFNE